MKQILNNYKNYQFEINLSHKIRIRNIITNDVWRKVTNNLRGSIFNKIHIINNTMYLFIAEEVFKDFKFGIK